MVLRRHDKLQSCNYTGFSMINSKILLGIEKVRHDAPNPGEGPELDAGQDVRPDVADAPWSGAQRGHFSGPGPGVVSRRAQLFKVSRE